MFELAFNESAIASHEIKYLRITFFRNEGKKRVKDKRYDIQHLQTWRAYSPPHPPTLVNAYGRAIPNVAARG